MNKPHQETQRKGIRGLRDRIKNATQNISNRISEVTTNVKEVVAENNLQTVKQNIQEKNQYEKDLESLAAKYDATTKVSAEDVLSLENLGEFDMDTDTIVNVNKFTDHNIHAAREKNRLAGGDGNINMITSLTGGKGRRHGYFASGNQNNPIPQSTRNLIFNKQDYLNFITGGRPEMKKPGWIKGGLWDTNTKKKKAKAKKATKQQKPKKK